MVILLKTKLGVTYDGGHWFHMAENFMASFSELRRTHRTVNSSVLYFVFDENFVGQLNAITKYMLTVAVTSGTVKEVHFVYNPDSNSNGHQRLSTLAPGSTLFMHKLRKNRTTATHIVVHLGADVPMAERFIKNAVHHHHDREGLGHCAKYFGSLGGKWPTMQRGHWFPEKGDVDVFRKRTAMLCPRDDTAIALYRKKTAYKLIIYQRDLSRKLLDHDMVISELQRTLGSSWSIELIMHKFDRSPCELAHALIDVDVLITPHGFQSMVLLFLPRPSLLFEVFPFRYQKTGYAPLSREYGVFYGASMSPPVSPLWKFLLSFLSTEQCMLNKFCRNFARDDDIRVTELSLIRIRDAISDYVDAHRINCLKVLPSGTSTVSQREGPQISNPNKTIVSSLGLTSQLDHIVCDKIYSMDEN